MENLEHINGTLAELDDIDHSLKDYERIADLSAEAYLKSMNKVKHKSNLCLICFLLAGIILALISTVLSGSVFASINAMSIIGLIFAFMSIAVSFFSASDRIFGWNKEIADYEHGFKVFKQFSRDLHGFRKSELPSLNESEKKLRADRFVRSYSLLVSVLPPNNLSKKEFSYLKQEVELARLANKELDKDPHCDLSKFFKD